MLHKNMNKLQKEYALYCEGLSKVKRYHQKISFKDFKKLYGPQQKVKSLIFTI